MNNTIGIGIITCNRVHFFRELINSIPNVDKIVVVNDGRDYENKDYPSKITEVIQHKKNMGIAKTKNDALKYLLDQGCKHIFLLEDDIAIRDQSIIEKYIRAAKVSGILHFNYAYHGKWNKNSLGEPIYKSLRDYGDNVKIAFHSDFTGALSYFQDFVLHKVGLMDEIYSNVLEHVDHTYQIAKQGFHPPFRWFADIPESFNSIVELDPMLTQSVNAQKILSIKLRAKIFGAYFRLKNGYRPYGVPQATESEFLKSLDEIKIKYAIR